MVVKVKCLEERLFEIAQLLVFRGASDQASLDRASPSDTPIERGRKIIYEAANESRRYDTISMTGTPLTTEWFFPFGQSTP